MVDNFISKVTSHIKAVKKLKCMLQYVMKSDFIGIFGVFFDDKSYEHYGYQLLPTVLY